MKRASLKEGIWWIALNDDSLLLDTDDVAAQISVCLLADLFGKDTKEVAAKIVKLRLEVQAGKYPGVSLWNDTTLTIARVGLAMTIVMSLWQRVTEAQCKRLENVAFTGLVVHGF